MLRGAADPRRRAQGLGAEIETNEFYYAEGEDAARNDRFCDPTLTFEPSEEASLATLTSRTRSSATADDWSVLSHQQRGRQQTAPSLGLLRVSTQEQSPVCGHTRHLCEMALTGDGRVGQRQEASVGRFAGWLGGASGPPSRDGVSPDAAAKSKSDLTPKSASTTQSRFGFLTSLTGRLTAQSPTWPQFGDELLDLDIQGALYPSASPADRDTFSPAAYKNLQTNAAGFLQRMQNAYRQRTMAFQELQAERSAEKEESEETTMRVENLKMQLEHMASKAAEQERAMQQLVGELKAERRARHEDITRERLMAEGLMVHEDLGVDDGERQKWRESGVTVKSDNSFDTDEESAESESVFSRSRSPTMMTSATESTLDLPLTNQGKGLTLAPPPKPKTAKDMTTFQKLMKGISGETVREDDEDMRPDGCSNCRGQEASVAWDTVSLLRDENKGLKHRVAQLEVAVDGALDMVHGIGL